MSTIGERVKAAREKCGIHQAELARRLSCSVNALSMLENNAITDPRASRIIGIAEVLQVSADYLLGLAPATPQKAQTARDEAGAPAHAPRKRRATAIAGG